MTNSEYYAIIGQRLAAARMLMQLTQEELAAQLGVTRGNLALIEAGRKSMPLARFHMMCELLGVNCDRILSGVEVPEVIPQRGGMYCD